MNMMSIIGGAIGGAFVLRHIQGIIGDASLERMQRNLMTTLQTIEKDVEKTVENAERERMQRELMATLRSAYYIQESIKFTEQELRQKMLMATLLGAMVGAIGGAAVGSMPIGMDIWNYILKGGMWSAVVFAPLFTLTAILFIRQPSLWKSKGWDITDIIGTVFGGAILGFLLGAVGGVYGKFAEALITIKMPLPSLFGNAVLINIIIHASVGGSVASLMFTPDVYKSRLTYLLEGILGGGAMGFIRGLLFAIILVIFKWLIS